MKEYITLQIGSKFFTFEPIKVKFKSKKQRLKEERKRKEYSAKEKRIRTQASITASKIILNT